MHQYRKASWYIVAGTEYNFYIRTLFMWEKNRAKRLEVSTWILILALLKQKKTLWGSPKYASLAWWLFLRWLFWETEESLKLPFCKRHLHYKGNFHFFHSLNWSTVDLQCCVSFYTEKWFKYIHTYIYIYIFFFIVFSIMVYHRILNIIPCTVQ